MSIIALQFPHNILCCIDWEGHLVALRLIGMAFLFMLEGLVLQALWHLLMMALIALIAIGDGNNCIGCNWQWRCCLL
jgi:hypothetical protein